MLKAFLPSLIFAGLLGGAGSLAETLSYNREIRPILSDNCFSCHGFDPKTREAGLRLDTREGATANNDGVVAIVPGDVAKSELWIRIHSTDKDEVMPPPKTHKRISLGQKEKLRRWIEQGAPYEKHWSFVPPAAVALPAVKPAHGPRNPIDHFVLAGLEGKGLQPSPEAKRETLIRRVTLDLTGLPPTPAEVEAFSRRRLARRLRKGRGPIAGLAALRRAHGGGLAGRRALRGHQRLPGRSRP